MGEVVVRLEDKDGVAEALEADGAGGALGDPHVPGLQCGLLRLLYLGPWRVLILDASGGEALTDPGAGVGSTLSTCQLWDGQQRS